MCEKSKQVYVRLHEAVSHGGRVFGFNEEHQISREDAERYGNSVTILRDAPGDFPAYKDSVYGDNEAARNRDPQDPADVEPLSVGESEVEAEGEVHVDRKEKPETKDAIAPENKMVGKAPVKK